MFVFVILATPLSTSQEFGIKLLEKYVKFFDMFDTMKANRLLEYRLYDCLIDLQLGKEPLWG
jgi:hypothetical protein